MATTTFQIPQQTPSFPMPTAQTPVQQAVPMQTQQPTTNAKLGRPTVTKGQIYTKTPNQKCPHPGRKYETYDETQTFCWLDSPVWEAHEWQENTCSQGANEGLRFRTCKKTGKFDWIDNPRKRKTFSTGAPDADVSARIDSLEKKIDQIHQMCMMFCQQKQ